MKSIARIEVKFIIWVTIRDKGERNVAIQRFDQSAKTWLRNKNLCKMLQKPPICVDFKMEIKYILRSPKFCKRVDMKINAFFSWGHLKGKP